MTFVQQLTRLLATRMQRRADEAIPDEIPPIPSIRVEDWAEAHAKFLNRLLERYLAGHVKYKGSDLRKRFLDEEAQQELDDLIEYRLARKYRAYPEPFEGLTPHPQQKPICRKH